jgi:hypothetical protein
VPLHILIIRRAIELSRHELNQPLQLIVQNQCPRPLKQGRERFILTVARTIDGWHVGIEIDNQNVVLQVTTVIMARFSGDQAGSPGVQVRTCSVHTQVGLSTNTDNNLVMLVTMVV